YWHHMAMGYNIGYSTMLSQNNDANTGLYKAKINDSARGVHMALMGDPTLRMHVVTPPSGLTIPGGTLLSWSASPDTVLGYYVYRAADPSGPYTRLTPSLIAATTFLDTNPSGGAVTYMVRAVKLE